MNGFANGHPPQQGPPANHAQHQHGPPPEVPAPAWKDDGWRAARFKGQGQGTPLPTAILKPTNPLNPFRGMISVAVCSGAPVPGSPPQLGPIRSRLVDDGSMGASPDKDKAPGLQLRPGGPGGPGWRRQPPPDWRGNEGEEGFENRVEGRGEGWRPQGAGRGVSHPSWLAGGNLKHCDACPRLLLSMTVSPPSKFGDAQSRQL